MMKFVVITKFGKVMVFNTQSAAVLYKDLYGGVVIDQKVLDKVADPVV
jgi:hypothetical protein